MAIIPNLSFSDYCKLPGLNASKLKAMRRSPAHAQLHREDTPSLRMGRALHTMVLEPEKFKSEYVVGGPINPKTGKEYGSETKAFSEWLAEQCVGVDGDRVKEHITTAEYEQCTKMKQALQNHPFAQSLIVMCLFGTEVTLTWDEPFKSDHGSIMPVPWNIPAKARFDGIRCSSKENYVIDLKTTRDASPKGFSYAVSDYGYHIQEAWYRRGCKANGIPCENFYFIVVESDEPYGVGVYTLAPEWIMAADRIIDDLLPIYAECEKTGIWPAYSQEVQEIKCPDYIAGVQSVKI